jgi:hypothetical protein
MSLAVSAASVSGHAPIRVMVVDDAVVVRGLVSRWIGAVSYKQLTLPTKLEV